MKNMSEKLWTPYSNEVFFHRHSWRGYVMDCLFILAKKPPEKLRENSTKTSKKI
jgi:hypothetical protein